MARLPKKKKRTKSKKTVLLRHTYRSGLEDSLAKQLKKRKQEFTYEQERVTYTIPESYHIYIPDFVVTSDSGNLIYIEAKGIWTYEDRYKHLLVRQQHPDLDIRFVFTRAKSRIRKGASTTYKDICEGRGRGLFKGVTWKHADKKIPEEWLAE